MKVKIKVNEIEQYLNIETPNFPKYISTLINLANQYAQGTRPKIVGKMSDLIREFHGKSIEEWENWYLEKHPDAIQKAKTKILEKLQDLKHTMDKIDETMVEKWVKDLIIYKTFIGLKFQEAILIKGSELFNLKYRLSTPEEESQGIDGFIGEIPVSIKPNSYKFKKTLQERINVKIIF